MADSPLGYVNNGNSKKEEAFRKLQAYLLKDSTQAEIAALGRRVGLGGLGVAYDKTVFKAEWGVDPSRILTPLRLPAADVILRALTLYQTEFRKPSLTVYCLDFSGSMARRLRSGQAGDGPPARSPKIRVPPSARRRRRLHRDPLQQPHHRRLGAEGQRSRELAALLKKISTASRRRDRHL